MPIEKLRQWIDEFRRRRIPKNTIYCHDANLRACPYWKLLKYKDEYGNNLSYCKYCKVADTYESLLLLWDQCKICGIWEDDEDSMGVFYDNEEK